MKLDGTLPIAAASSKWEDRPEIFCFKLAEIDRLDLFLPLSVALEAGAESTCKPAFVLAVCASEMAVSYEAAT